jgi:hypothetical protein
MRHTALQLQAVWKGCGILVAAISSVRVCDFMQRHPRWSYVVDHEIRTALENL